MDKPQMNYVIGSSNVKAMGHHADRNELHVQFNSGDHYVYHGVDADVAAKAAGASSVGGFLNKNIKGKFKHEKLA